MGRLNIYIPDDLEQQMRETGISPSALLQQVLPDAIADARAKRALDGYIRDLADEVGSPTTDDDSWAQAQLASLLNQRANP